MLDVDVEYSPETFQQNYLIIPDRSEVTTIQKMNLRGTFFSSKPITLTLFTNVNQNRINRDDMSNLKSKDFIWGSSLTFKNKRLPMSFGYNQATWDQEELQTDRTFKVKKSNFHAKANTSLTPIDKHELSFNLDGYQRQDVNPNIDVNSMKNDIYIIKLTDELYFDKDRNYSFRSIVTNYDQKGYVGIRRFQTNESFVFKLPNKMKWVGSYNFYNFQLAAQKSNNHTIFTEFAHKLYLSLKSSVFFEYSNINHTVYRESNTKGGLGLNYSKNIPKGNLNIVYKYRRHHHNMNADPVQLIVGDKQYTLIDGDIILFDHAYIDINTVVVKDLSGVIIYQEGLDYQLFERNDYIEIRRILGGQIVNNSSVLVDYITTKPGDYSYDVNSHTFEISCLMFSRLIKLYYRKSINDYVNINQTEFLTLNYFTKDVIGARLNFDFGSIGAEVDNYESTIIPYRSIRYFTMLRWDYKRKLLCSLNGNLMDYNKIGEDGEQRYTDVSGKIAYQFRPATKLNIELGYRNQKGEGIDLDLFITRADFTSLIRQLYFSVGFEMYKRLYLGEDFNLKGVYMQIKRKF